MEDSWDDPEYRHGLVCAGIEIDLPMQIRGMLAGAAITRPVSEIGKACGLSEDELELVQNTGASFTIDLLLKLAKGLGVALQIQFMDMEEFLQQRADPARREPHFSGALIGIEAIEAMERERGKVISSAF